MVGIMAENIRNRVAKNRQLVLLIILAASLPIFQYTIPMSNPQMRCEKQRSQNRSCKT